MLTRSVRSLTVLACGIAAAGCFQSADNVDSSQVNPRAVYQMYAATYHAAADGTQLFARLRVGGSGGTNLSLSPPSAVTANGQPLAPKDGVVLSAALPGRYYEAETRGFRPDYEFVFTGHDGRAYRNTTRIEPADHDPMQPTELSRSRSHTIPFVGPPLRPGEVVVLVLDTTADRPVNEADKKHGIATAMSREAGATAVTLAAADLARLSGDTGKLMWQRTWKHPLREAGDAGGEMEATYYSKPIAVTLVK